MYYRDHNPPHFHARYGHYEILFDIQTGAIKGHFPKRALMLLNEWYEAHKNELIENWQRAQAGEVLLTIEPLE